MWRVGFVWLEARPSGRHAQVFEERLVEIGYAPGRNVILAYRFTDPPNVEKTLRELLPDIDLLVVWTTFGSVAAKKLAGSMPVVFLGVGAPVDIGLVKSLAEPGGNMTGVTFEAGSETYARRMQLLTEIVPNLKRVAILRTVGDPNVTFAMLAIERAAPQLGVTLLAFDIKTVDDLEEAFQGMTRSKAEALLIISSAVTAGAHVRIASLSLVHHLPTCGPFRQAVAAGLGGPERAFAEVAEKKVDAVLVHHDGVLYGRIREIVALAARHRIPAIYFIRECAELGGLMSYGPDPDEMLRQAGLYAGRILKGEKPADLPVQQPTKFQLVINLKTAKALGLTVSPSLLARADEVIE